MQILLTDTIRLRWIATALACQIFLLLAGCGHSVEDVSKTPPPEEPAEKPPAKVVASLSDELKQAQAKNLGLRATLFLDNATEYDMDISNGMATWQKADLPDQSPYDLTVRFELEIGNNSGKYLLVAEENTTHNFSAQATKTFQASDLSTAFDEDDDTMSNLAEFLVGGNPVNPAPTLLSEAQITVLENSTQFLTVQAISPRADPVVYSIVLNDNDLFAIDTKTGLLGFKIPILFSANTANQYSLTIRADDGSFTAEQTIAVTVTDVFDLKVDTALKQLQFHWTAAPGTAYYKILRSLDGGTMFTELPDSGNITSLNHNHPLSIHRFDQLNTRFKLQAYDTNDLKIRESEAIAITASLNDAIGYVKSNLVTTGEHFGGSFALSSNGDTLVVGAPGLSGEVYVFSYIISTWQYQGSVKASNSEVGDGFGNSVAISADGNTLVVGAVNEDSNVSGISDGPVVPDDNNKTDSGAVYVFNRANNADSFAPQAYIKAPNREVGARFGNAVALSADGNTLVVGSYGERSVTQGVYDAPVVPYDNSAQYSGAVYVFERVSNAETFALQAYIKAPNSEINDFFGTHIALSADGNTLVVGALFEDSAGSGISVTPVVPDDNSVANSGAVYVYGRASKTDMFALQAYVKAANSETNDLFGDAVAISSDGNTLAVGANNEDSAVRGVGENPVVPEDNGARDSGAVYVFSRANNSAAFNLGAYIKAPNGEAVDSFGSSVALSADGNTLAVGAKWEDSAARGVSPIVPGDNSAPGSGAVYVFGRASNADAFASKAYVKAPNSEKSDYFGTTAALSADGNTLIVGATSEDSAASGISVSPVVPDDNSAPGSGAVYLY